MEGTTVQGLITTYSQLSEEQQARVLCRLSGQLTVDARNTYRPKALDANQAVTMLSIFNELQHSIVYQLLHLLLHDARRYPDDLFIKIIVEKNGRLSELVMRNLDQAMRAL